MTAHTLDFALLCVGALACWIGWRRGLLVSVFSILGLLAGVWIGRALVDQFLGATNENLITQAGINLMLMLLGLSVGSALGSIFGRRLRTLLKWKPLHYIDRSLGSALSFFTWTLVVWFIGTTFLSGPSPTAAKILSESRIVRLLDAHAPEQVRTGIEWVRGYVSEAHLPDGLVSEILAPQVELPDPSLTALPEIRNVLGSVVRVEGNTRDCQTSLTGSGFVAGPHLVVTNAHVVAGVTNPVVRIQGKGQSYAAIVVYFDPQRDVAILKSKSLLATPIPIGKQVSRSTSLLIAGFPGGKSLMFIPARVRSVTVATGRDIYNEKEVSREIYSLRSIIRQGDSGAPLLTSSGDAVGMVFAASSNDPTTGYALTPQEFLPGLKAAQIQTESVDTGKCSRL